MKTITSFLLLFFAFATKAGDEFCGVRNTAFKAGEEVTMKVYYTTLGMYVGAGEAYLPPPLKNLMETCLSLCWYGKLFFFDNFFKVDRYETYIDTATMLP